MRNSIKITIILLLSLSLSLLIRVYAYPSGGKFPPTFQKHGNFWYDEWNINRNSYLGEDGYMPNMFYETIGNYSDLAYRWGLDFKQRYSNKVELARSILRFVQQWVQYGYDEENVFMEGEAQLEWAWNGDEMAHMVKNAMNTLNVAIADCEDVAFFCATLYYAAGFDVALVDAPGHCALLIWFPNYPNANTYWNIHDGRGYGWIWIEATGKQNQVGWTPPSFSDGNFIAYPITKEIEEVLIIESVYYSPLEPSQMEEVQVNAKVKVIFSQVKNVNIIYSVNGGEQETVNMVSIDSSIYEGDIPGQRVGSNVKFYIEILRVRGDIFSSDTYIYEVKETIFGVEPLLLYLVGGILLVIILLSIFA